MKVELKKLICYLLLIGIIGFGTVRYVVQRVDVYGTSMEPTYLAGDILLADKLTLRFSELKRFETVVFRYQYGDHQHYIKRIIGLPGETVQIIDGKIWINGSLLNDPYAAELMINPKRAAKPIILGAEEYFVLGDNRNDSSDSRDSDIGNVSRKQILGRSGIRIWQGKKEQTHENIE